MRKGILLLFVLSITICNSFALNEGKKSLEIIKVSQGPEIDGVLDDEAWQNATYAKDFVQFEPYNGGKATLQTEVKVIYDNQAIYFGAMMFDNNPDSIIAHLGNRDDFTGINADIFAVILGTFNDGVNAVEFMVSASGIQSDAKHNGVHGDGNWDAVWESKVGFNEKGWVVEMKIPYSALRFSKEEIQTWGVSFFRQVRRNREWTTWNHVDNTVRGFVNQMSELTGIRNIQPPLRLSVTPYVSGYLENAADGNKWNNDLNAGMDLKWGINQSFTLDMILIPDFGQVQSDDEILNLSPYEVRYNEKRPFFTEGTELFNKANIFYSRRIGSRPKNSSDVYNDLNDNEEVKENPAETQLINATKISGRTSSGLGIGFLNAMTGAVEATIQEQEIDQIIGNDTIYKFNKRYFQTQGFTNYNMFVLDQTLKNNSYVSLANTNVMHAEENYTANVTGTEFKLMNKENSYQIFGSGAISQIYTDENNYGHKYFLQLAKTKGNFLFELAHNTESDTYDPNDMGFIRQNNESTWYAEIDYNFNQPFWKVLNWRNEINFRYQNLYNPRKFTDFQISFITNTTFAKSYIHTGLFLNVRPTEGRDYFEPRVDGHRYNTPRSFRGNWWISSDYRKKLAIDFRFGGWKAMDYDRYGYWTAFGPRIRFSDRWLLTYRVSVDANYNTFGYVNDYDIENTVGDTITIVEFGMRDQLTITNTLNTSYIFNDKMSLSLRARHYWSRVEYDNFHELNKDGTLSDALGYDLYGSSNDYNYNAFTVDMKYLWRFMPGSELAVVWKNAIYTGSNDIVNNFWDNFDNTITASQINSLSLKLLVYLDYQYLKR